MVINGHMRGGVSAVVLLVLLVSAVPAVAQTIVLDNDSPEFSVLSGEWETGTSAPGHWGADYRWRGTTGWGYTFGEVEWRPSIPTAGYYSVSVYYPQGTNRAVDAPYTVHHVSDSSVHIVNQQTGGGQWNTLGSYYFVAGTSGRVTLSNDAGENVVIADAVRFEATANTIELTMEAVPSAWGGTSPAAGGTYTKVYNEVVVISANAAVGYEFDHWEVSGGMMPANPSAEVTTVVADQDKTVTAVFVEEGSTPGQFRAFWADAFHAGFKSEAEIDTMVSWALAGNYNAIIPEILAFHDTGGSGHGAYWDSSIVPQASDISGGIDPLEYLIAQAHANGLEVHPWLVAFRVCSSWPPYGNSAVGAHPEWLMVPSADMGGGAAPIGSYYTFDPGSPDVQEYLMSIVRELVSSYEIDGIHWDYIRYTQTDAGYPADLSYTKSSLRRFQDITGYSGTPSTTYDPWDDFRRRTITEVVRRAMFEVPTIDNPRQPLRHSAALVTWYPASTDFTNTGAYKYFCDWEHWQSEGYLDATVPMAYFSEDSYPSTYRAWVDNSIMWAENYNRHTFIGPGIYLNSFADSVTQLAYAINQGANGISTYSYGGTNDTGDPWSDWYAYVATNLFDEPAEPPTMPWRDPIRATRGTVYGRVTDGSTGDPIDNATVQIDGGDTVQADGNGYYIATKLSAGESGSIIPFSATYSGYAEVHRPAVLVERAGFTEINFALGAWALGDYDVDGDVDLDDYAEFAACMTGPEGGPLAAGCDLFDFDDDADIDLQDYQVFQSSVGS